MLRTVLLLAASNAFMTLAWYGHLKFRDKPMLLAIAASWLIALPEYALQVPANRWGYGTLGATQLKILQEVISLTVFIAFAWWYLGEAPTWRTGGAMLLVVAAVALARGGPTHDAKPADAPPGSVEQASAPDPRADADGSHEARREGGQQAP